MEGGKRREEEGRGGKMEDESGKGRRASKGQEIKRWRVKRKENDRQTDKQR